MQKNIFITHKRKSFFNFVFMCIGFEMHYFVCCMCCLRSTRQQWYRLNVRPGDGSDVIAFTCKRLWVWLMTQILFGKLIAFWNVMWLWHFCCLCVCAKMITYKCKLKSITHKRVICFAFVFMCNGFGCMDYFVTTIFSIWNLWMDNIAYHWDEVFTQGQQVVQMALVSCSDSWKY